MWQAFFSIQLLGADGTGCTYGSSTDPVVNNITGYASAWYGDATAVGGSAATPQLGLFFPTTVTLIPNYLGMGVGNDPTNLQLLNTWCSTPGPCQTNWTAIPAGANSWYAATTPAPYITLPASAWPACTGGVMNFLGGSYTTTAGATTAATSGAKGMRAVAGAALLAALPALVL